MKRVTVNLVVEISEGGESNVYKASNGAQFTGMVQESDVINLVNLSCKQVIAEGIAQCIVAFQKPTVIAQDAYVEAED